MPLHSPVRAPTNFARHWNLKQNSGGDAGTCPESALGRSLAPDEADGRVRLRGRRATRRMIAMVIPPVPRSNRFQRRGQRTFSGFLGSQAGTGCFWIGADRFLIRYFLEELHYRGIFYSNPTEVTKITFIFSVYILFVTYFENLYKKKQISWS